MTAVVGILNKQAVALATDSAVTISGSTNKKIFNRANKLFALSKHHPIGLMLFNSATFMGTPWETIIKVYRKELGKQSFPTVEAYLESFIKFLHLKNFFTDGDSEKLYLKDYFMKVIDALIKEAVRPQKHLVQEPSEENKVEVLKLIEAQIDKQIQSALSNPDHCQELSDLTFEEFEQHSLDVLNETIDLKFIKNGFVLSESLILKIRKVMHEYLISCNMPSYSGLIFAGFGEDEIYPSLIPINVSFSFKNRLRYYIDSSMDAKISNTTGGAICPFAQTDVIDTILSGIAPNLDTTYLENFEMFFTKYNEEILNILGNANADLTTKIKNLNIKQLVEEYTQKINQNKQSNYINPLMNAVSTLSKEDLAEMAESLIYLTYLKRRITFAEESVGGPVDVAIISKGDGFIWIKRKHYFKPELNQQFFDNYFN